MTSSQLILVALTSALISVFMMLFVATLRRARTRDDEETRPVVRRAPEELTVAEEMPAERPPPRRAKASAKTTVRGTAAKKSTAKKTTAKKTTSKKTPARKAPATRKKR